MRKNGLSYRETVRKYWGAKTRSEEDNYKSRVKAWERIYLSEGEAGFMTERRGQSAKGRPKKSLSSETEEDLIAENQRLKEELEYTQMELEYLKKLDALVRAEEQRNGKKPQ